MIVVDKRIETERWYDLEHLESYILIERFDHSSILPVLVLCATEVNAITISTRS